MKAIIAVNNLGFIGLDNGLPWRSKADFKHFKEMTMGGTLLVGSTTAATLPPLSGRKIIVASKLMAFHDIVSEDETNGFWVLDKEKWVKIDWCIGGKFTYERFCPCFTELHISHINDNTIGDVGFPILNSLNVNCKIFNYHFDVDLIR